jgi:hypothetical protein
MDPPRPLKIQVKPAPRRRHREKPAAIREAVTTGRTGNTAKKPDPKPEDKPADTKPQPSGGDGGTGGNSGEAAGDQANGIGETQER